MSTKLLKMLKMDKSFFLITSDSTLKKKERDKKMARNSNHQRRKLDSSEVNSQSTETFMLMMLLELPIEPILQWLVLMYQPRLLVSS
jgi:hypothetical protein